MESLGFLDTAWRVVLAGVFALTPGMVFWMLVLGLLALVRRLGHRHRLSEPARGATRP